MTEQKILPKRMIGGENGSFAFKSLNERLPKIVTGIVDRLHRFHHNAVDKWGKEAGDDVTAVIAKLSEMRYRMMTDKSLEPISSEFPDAALWNDEIDQLNKERKETKSEANESDGSANWYGSPWMFVECYMYRRIRQFFQQSQFLREFDPFNEDKEKSYRDSSKYMLAIGTELVREIDAVLSAEEIRRMVLRLLQISLWGNKCDLSLTGGDPHFMSDTIFHELDQLRPHILADDLDKAVDEYLGRPQKRIDIVLDNSGLEVFVDLCLSDFLLSKGLASKVILHGKEYPWFVSDTMEKDLKWIIEQLSAEGDEFLSKLGKRWNDHLQKGALSFEAHPFWTRSFDYSTMREKAPELYEHLAQSAIVVFKGDMNYRKLVGDRAWPHQTPFSDALCGFCPTALLALRTLKAETVAGVPLESLRKIKEKFGEKDLSWMSSSEYAVAQLCGRRNGP
ncbi:hypothetical protein niasHT_027954 [Heterodera trifolii]|uniref:Sugar phosphate phosphatase n=1 Tax=Heterodera trifolii TaxID=157864 RepID=A0ABD2KER4_9BILA